MLQNSNSKNMFQRINKCMCSHTFWAYKQKKCYFHAKIWAKVLQIKRIVVPLHQNYKF